MIASANAPDLERSLHKRFLETQVNQVNPRKEFFKVAIADIKSELDKLGIQAKWTMTAEAREYRESLVLNRVGQKEKAAA